MQRAKESIGPLSPFLWDAPHVNLVPPGFTPGTVTDAMLQISDLTLNFNVLGKAIDHSFHPVRRAMESHPIHTRMLHKRQFDVMRYGMVLDEVERLVIVPMPPLCGDTVAKVSQEYAAIFRDDFNCTPYASHPIIPEYCFVVYQLSEASEGCEAFSTPIFRLVFRNEAFNEQVKMQLVDKFPLFYLRSVYVSHTRYYSFQRQLNLYAKASASSERLPDYALEEALGLSGLRWLFDAWLLVLEGIAPTWLVDKGVGPDIVSLFLASHRPEGKYDVKENLEAYTQLPVDNRVRCMYYSSGDRMRRRVQVMQRFPQMINEWRRGAYDIRYFGVEKNSGEPSVCLARCFRMLLCRRKPDRNYVEDDEVVAFIPHDDECKPLQVYNTLAAERLRLWVLKGLLTAELHGIHSMILEFDTTMVVAECVGLLWGDCEGDHHREAVFHVCKIIVETVEDYVQHSGVIWRVIIVTSDDDTLKSANLCQDILEVTQMAKTRVEIEERQCVAAAGTPKVISSSLPSDSGITAPHESDECEEITSEQDEKYEKNAILVAQSMSGTKPNRENMTNDANPTTTVLPSRPIEGSSKTKAECISNNAIVPVTNMLSFVQGSTTSGNFPFCNTVRFSEAIRDCAARCGVRISDAELYPIFLALSGGKDVVLINDIVQLILEKQREMNEGSFGMPQSHQRMLCPNNHPICPLDSCGVPYDTESITNFVKSFQRQPYRAQSEEFKATVRPTTPRNTPDSLNYVEFSILMLALARQ